MYFVFHFCWLRPFFATNCKDSASRAQYKKSSLFFIAEAPPILSKDSDKRAKNMKLTSIFSLRVQYPFTKIASFARKRLFFT